MKSANAIYKIIKAFSSTTTYQWYEIRITQGNNVYGLDTLKSVVINASLSSEEGIGVGSANSTECRITLSEQSVNWPRMAKFTIQFRLCSGNYASNWLSAGSFYTDERTEDKYGNLSIRAFDKMLMMEQSWTDKIPEELLPASYPITAYAWANMIQEAGLAEFYDLNQLDNTVAFVGLDTTTTIRDVLKSIAAVHAGNWVMTSDEKLKLIQYTNLDISQASSNDYVNLGMEMKNFDDSPALEPVSGVHLETEAGTVMEAGNETGYVLKANCSVATTTGVADICLSRIQGYVYKPFSATGAFLDPVAEIGDSIAVDGEMYQLMSAVWDFSKHPIATIEAPYDKEIDHEYTIISQDAKNYRKTMAAVDEKMGDYVAWEEFSTAIEQNEQAITLVASHTFVTQNDFDEEIANIQNQLDGNIQSWSGNVVPTLNNAPAVDWNTAALKAEHVGDMYFINSDAGIPEAGQYYRFEENNGVYSWQLITDSAITEALAQAAAALAAAEGAQDTADAASAEAQMKGRVFVVQPTPPYSVGDLWFNSTESVIKVCMTARESGNFVDSDWVKRDKYTDDSAFLAFQETYSQTIAAIQDQVDKKAETYYQANDPANEWVGAAIAGIAIAGLNVVGIETAVALGHKGDLWYRTTDKTTWFWNGSAWEQQDVPDEVFDKIDGKAQIFINTPYPPYNVGDLWFNSANSDIMTCTVARATGSFNQGDWEKRNKYTDDSALTSFINATYSPAIAAIQAELDGKVDTYFYNYEPTLSNVPASGWNTNAIKDEHVDDLFYNTTNGYTYRFTKSGSTYSWTRVKDSDITTAMAAASTAQDTADGKRRVFVSQPTDSQAYDVGDLWVNATYGTTYTNDILKCKTAKAEGASFSISHWEKASKYTDDSSFTAFVNSVYTPEIAALQSDLDGKVDTYFYAYAPTLLNIPASEWNTDAKRDEHVDDLFFDTVSGYTYRFAKSGSTHAWQRVKDSDITSAMTAASLAQDTADGKRRVFVSQPTNAQEYDIGDLWVNATYGSTYSNDLLRCKTAKAAGASFNIAHWEKASKYTDDTAANAVAAELTTFEASFTVQPEQIAAEIAKNVVKDKQSTRTTFGWLLNDTSHTWYANNQEVMKVQQSGLSVTGSITATSGYIGNGSSGFEIGSTYIRNGVQGINDTSHTGVYIGTNGIVLGQGTFKVTSSGAVTASNLAITGGSIKLGGTASNPVFQVTSSGAVTASNLSITGGSISINNGAFYVDSNGNLSANNGTFGGNVYAKNIQYGGTAGTYSGAGVTPGTIYGGSSSGQIAENTLGDYNVYKSGGAGAYTPASFSSGVQGSLYNADVFGYATQRGSASYPAYFAATLITALSSFYSPAYYVDTGSDATEFNLATHYHTITVNDNGTVTFGLPYASDTPPSFNIADTHYYQDGVSAVTVTSLDIEYTYDDEMHIYRIIGKAKNQAGEIVYQSTSGQWNTDRSAYIDGKADGADEVTITAITRTYPDGESSYPYYDSPTLGKIIEFKAQVSMSNNHGDSTVLNVPAESAYNAGYEAGSAGGSGSVTVTSLGLDPNDSVSYSATVNNYYVPIKTVLSNSITRTTTVTVSGQEAYSAGQTAGVASVTCSTLGLDTGWSTSSTGYIYQASNRRYAVRGKATLSNGVTYSATMYVPDTDAYNAGVTEGQSSGAASVTITAITRTYPDGESSYPYYDSATLGKVIEFKAQATMSNGQGGSQVLTVPADAAYDAGAQSITVSSIGLNTSWSTSATGYVYETANNRYAANIRARLNNDRAWTSTVYIPASDAFNAGSSSASTVLTIASGSVISTTASNYTAYDSGYNFGLSGNLYTSGSYQYGRVQIKNAAGTVLKTMRLVIPASSSGSVTSITVTRDHNPSTESIANCMGDWEISGGSAYVKVNLEAFSGNTSVGTATGRVDVSDFIAFTAPTGATVLATSSASANNNYNWEVDLTGYTNAFYKSGNYQYVRFQLEDNEGYDLDIIRVKLPSTDTAISEVLALTSNSSTYLDYSYQASFYASSLYTPSGSSTTYARVQVNLNSGSSQVIRVALPASSGGTATVSRGTYPVGTYYNEYGYAIQYYKWTGNSGYVAVNLTQNGTTTGPYDINVTELVQASMAIAGGSTMTWNIYQHYDYGEADGWDCTVTCGGQTHTFWSASRIYA